MEVDQYFNEMPEGRRTKAQAVHKLVPDLLPQSRINMKHRLPTYESAKGWFAIGSQKHYRSIYTCRIEKISDYLTKHPGVKCGKGCINFRKKDNADLEAMKQVIRNAMNG